MSTSHNSIDRQEVVTAVDAICVIKWATGRESFRGGNAELKAHQVRGQVREPIEISWWLSIAAHVSWTLDAINLCYLIGSCGVRR